LNKVSGAKLVSPGGVVVDVEGGETKAYVVDRIAFDECLRCRAVDASAELIEERASVGVDRIIDASKVRYRAKKIVLASGTDYATHRRLGLDIPRKFLVGCQYEMKVDCDAGRVELYFNVPGFFSWVVPAGSYARVGCATWGNPIPYLDSLVKRLEKEGRLKSKEILSKTTGLIPVHEPSIRTQYPGLVTVGDACGHVKATSGGGVVYGGICGRLVSDENYEKVWRKVVGGELKLHLLLRTMLNRMSDRGLDNAFRLIGKHKSVLEEGGDMDSAKQTVAAMLKNPGVLGDVLLSSPSILLDLI